MTVSKAGVYQWQPECRFFFLQLSQWHGQKKVPAVGRVPFHAVLGFLISDDATK